MAEQVEIVQAADIAANVGGVTLTASTDEQAVAANISRERLIISADTADVWLGYGTAAVVGQGHCVRQGGPPFEERAWKGEVHLISTGAAVVGWTETVYEAGDEQGERPTGADTFVPSGPSDTPIPAPGGDDTGE